MANRRQRRLGRAADSVRVNVAHRCGHTLVWDFYGNGRLDAQAMRLALGAGMAPTCTKADLAGLMECPRCSGELAEPGDVSFPATGVCHAHPGKCPDSPHDLWLYASGGRMGA